MKAVVTNLFFLLVLGACALSPQIIEIDPVIKVDSAAARPVRLWVDVVDMRNSKVIGKRGGIYKETSDISTGENMNSNLHHNLSKALSNLGYQVAAKGESYDAGLIVKITDISYSAYTEKLLHKVDLRVAIAVVAQKNNREFSGGFTATRKKDYVKAPSIEQNEEIVNETLSLVLEKMLVDDDLNGFLNG